MSTRARDKELARLHQQRKRARDVERRRREAEAEAVRIEVEAARRERLDEQLAPGVLRAEIWSAPITLPDKVVPDGLGGYRMQRGQSRPARMITGPRVEIIDGRPVRMSALGVDSDPIAKLARDSKIVTERHLAAFRRLQQDWADVGAGPNVGAIDYLRAGGGCGDQLIIGKDGPMLAQIDARDRLERAVAFLGAFWPVVRRVVLDCVPLSVWLTEENLRRDAKGHGPMATANVLAWIGAAGARLADFYQPPKPSGERRTTLLTFAPARETYDMSVDVGECDDRT